MSDICSHNTCQEQRRWRLRTLGLHAAMLAAPWVLARGVPSWSGCLCKHLVGIECPACGITRAVGLLEQGRWHESLVQHPMGWAVLALLLALVAYFSGAVLLDRRVRIPWRAEARAYRIGEALLVGALLVGWVMKLAR